MKGNALAPKKAQLIHKTLWQRRYDLMGWLSNYKQRYFKL